MAAHPGHLPHPRVIAEQQRTAYRLHLRGVTVAEIADHLGISPGTVTNRITAERDSRKPDDIETLRQHQGDQLTEAHRTVSLVLAGAEDGELKLKAVDRLIKISESYRKLYAVDSPTPLEAALARRSDLESELIADAVLAAVRGVVAAADVDTAFASRLTEYAFELAARQMEIADGQDPGAAPEPPKPQLAIMPGAAVRPSDGLDHDGVTTTPHPRARDATDGVLRDARALLAELEDDDGPESDQAAS